MKLNDRILMAVAEQRQRIRKEEAGIGATPQGYALAVLDDLTTDLQGVLQPPPGFPVQWVFTVNVRLKPTAEQGYTGTAYPANVVAASWEEALDRVGRMLAESAIPTAEIDEIELSGRKPVGWEKEPEKP